jgi:hypothetical protein
MVTRKVETNEMWKEWERNTGEMKEGDKVTKGVKERKKMGERLRYERNYSC